MNQRVLPGPTVMADGELPGVLTLNSVTVPDVVTRAILPAFDSVNQRLPSGPATMLSAPATAVSAGTLLTPPEGVILATPLLLGCVNHRFPSPPSVMSEAPPGGVAESVKSRPAMVPSVVMRPTWSWVASAH